MHFRAVVSEDGGQVENHQIIDFFNVIWATTPILLKRLVH